jgi:hypothetical protein
MTQINVIGTFPGPSKSRAFDLSRTGSMTPFLTQSTAELTQALQYRLPEERRGKNPPGL